jgi:hypothetical protein
MEQELGRETEDRLNLKVGRGGVVDVEFAVQYLQLLHGGSHPAVRARGTLKALYELQRAGIVTLEQYKVLDEGYRFLRSLDVRLRLAHDASIDSFDPHGWSRKAGRYRGNGRMKVAGNCSAPRAGSLADLVVREVEHRQPFDPLRHDGLDRPRRLPLVLDREHRVAQLVQEVGVEPPHVLPAGVRVALLVVEIRHVLPSYRLDGAAAEKIQDFTRPFWD